jgi:hypothetical protein
MSVFTNCGFETGDLTNWDATNIVENGDGSATFVASTGSATYGSYGGYFCCETAGTGGSAEILALATIDLTSLNTLSFDYAIPIATVSNSELEIRSIGFVIFIRSLDESEEYNLIDEIYYNPENPPITIAWAHVDYDCSALTGIFTLRILAQANDRNPSG